YLQSHPLPAERVRGLEELARSSPHWDKKDSAALQARHDLMRAKLYGFIERYDAVGRRYPLSDNSVAGRYARAIAAYRFADAQAAFMRGELRTARQLAARAKTRFPVGSPGWIKADDIASYKPPNSALRQ